MDPWFALFARHGRRASAPYSRKARYVSPTVTRIERTYAPQEKRRLSWFVALVWAQNRRCDCCRFDLDPTAQLDHDHATGYLRGLVCCSCNVRIGWVERGKRLHVDTTAAKAYVLRWQEHQKRKREEAFRDEPEPS